MRSTAPENTSSPRRGKRSATPAPSPGINPTIVGIQPSDPQDGDFRLDFSSIYKLLTTPRFYLDVPEFCFLETSVQYALMRSKFGENAALDEKQRRQVEAELLQPVIAQFLGLLKHLYMHGGRSRLERLFVFLGNPKRLGLFVHTDPESVQAARYYVFV